MKMVVTSNPPCRLQRGELRRVPQRQDLGLVGYHLGCPLCVFVNLIVRGSNGQVVRESVESGELRVTLAQPIHCAYCMADINLLDGEAIIIKERDHVRPAP
jgi:hypothetical protein